MASLKTDTHSARSADSETRHTAEKSAILLLELLRHWKVNAPPNIQAKIGPNPDVSVRIGENQVYKGPADSPQIAAIPKEDIDYLKFATSLEQGYSHTDLTRDAEIKIGGHKVFEVVGGEVTLNQIGPSREQKISIDIPGVPPGDSPPSAGLPPQPDPVHPTIDTTAEEVVESSEPSTPTVGVATDTTSIPKPVPQVNTDIEPLPSPKFRDEPHLEQLFNQVNGISDNPPSTETELTSEGQEVNDTSLQSPSVDAVPAPEPGSPADVVDAVPAPEPGSPADVLDASRFIAKEMGERDFSGGRSVETDYFKIETYGNEVTVFDDQGNKVIAADQVSEPDVYHPSPELEGMLISSANELEQQGIEHDTPELEIDDGIEIDDD